jgi:hypothetical protein
MPPGPSHRPPLAMKLWLWQRLGRNKEPEGSSAAPAHALTSAMSLEALGHTVRNRIRAFFRHTRLVTILGTIILGEPYLGSASRYAGADADARCRRPPWQRRLSSSSRC